MKNKNLIFAGLGLYLFSQNVYNNLSNFRNINYLSDNAKINESEVIGLNDQETVESNNQETVESNDQETKNRCLDENISWTTHFYDLEVTDNYTVNDFIISETLENVKNKFQLQIIPSPFGKTNGVKITQSYLGKPSEETSRELEVNNSFLVLLNKDVKDNVKQLTYEVFLTEEKNYLLISSGSNYSIEEIDKYPHNSFLGCKVSILNNTDGSKKIKIESENILDIVAIYGEKIFLSNLKYILDYNEYC